MLLYLRKNPNFWTKYRRTQIEFIFIENIVQFTFLQMFLAYTIVVHSAVLVRMNDKIPDSKEYLYNQYSSELLELRC